MSMTVDLVGFVFLYQAQTQTYDDKCRLETAVMFFLSYPFFIALLISLSLDHVSDFTGHAFNNQCY